MRDAVRIRVALQRTGAPDAILCFGAGGIGDSLLCTAVARALAARGNRNIWILSAYPELFVGNPDVAAVLPFNEDIAATLAASGLRVLRTHYNRNHWQEGRDDPPAGHIIEMLCRGAGIDSGEVELRPFFHLSQREIGKGLLAERQIAIQTSGRGARFFMRTKEWFPERFNEVAAALSRTHRLIQIGHREDPAVPGAIDLRGRSSVRETAAILHQSELFIGLVGFPMHLARAVDCPSVIVYGGRELPTQSGYSAFSNISRRPQCSPCWLWHRCDHEMRCMEEISAADVLAAAMTTLSAPRASLPVDVADLGKPPCVVSR